MGRRAPTRILNGHVGKTGKPKLVFAPGAPVRLKTADEIDLWSSVYLKVCEGDALDEALQRADAAVRALQLRTGRPQKKPVKRKKVGFE